MKLIKGEWNKSIKFCWFLILENDLINFAPEDDVWQKVFYKADLSVAVLEIIWWSWVYPVCENNLKENKHFWYY